MHGATGAYLDLKELRLYCAGSDEALSSDEVNPLMDFTTAAYGAANAASKAVDGSTSTYYRVRSPTTQPDGVQLTLDLSTSCELDHVELYDLGAVHQYSASRFVLYGGVDAESAPHQMLGEWDHSGAANAWWSSGPLVPRSPSPPPGAPPNAPPPLPPLPFQPPMTPTPLLPPPPSPPPPSPPRPMLPPPSPPPPVPPPSPPPPSDPPALPGGLPQTPPPPPSLPPPTSPPPSPPPPSSPPPPPSPSPPSHPPLPDCPPPQSPSPFPPPLLPSPQPALTPAPSMPTPPLEAGANIRAGSDDALGVLVPAVAGSGTLLVLVLALAACLCIRRARRRKARDAEAEAETAAKAARRAKAAAALEAEKAAQAEWQEKAGAAGGKGAMPAPATPSRRQKLRSSARRVRKSTAVAFETILKGVHSPRRRPAPPTWEPTPGVSMAMPGEESAVV